MRPRTWFVYFLAPCFRRDEAIRATGTSAMCILDVNLSFYTGIRMVACFCGMGREATLFYKRLADSTMYSKAMA